MEVVLVGATFIIALFAFTIFTGAPYLPTLRQPMLDAFELLDLKPGQTLLELGSGDGRVLRVAAQRGIRAIGYEINPLLVICSKVVTWRYRKLVTIHWANFWHVTLPATDGIYVFLTAAFMQRLDTKITQEYKTSVKVVSFAFALPHHKTLRKKGGLMVYELGSSMKVLEKH